MKMNGMSCDIQFTKKSDGYIHYKTRTISSDLPNQYDHEDVTSKSFNWFLALVPGYKYTINIQGLCIVKLYQDTNPTILNTASHDAVSTVSLNGRRGTWNAGDNHCYFDNRWTLTNVLFHNSGYIVPDMSTDIVDTPTSNNAGVTFTIENNTDQPYVVFFEHYGHPFLVSDYTTLAYYLAHCQVLIEHIETVTGQLVMDRYAGYHDKSQMMHYLNAYWTTYDLYLNNLMWNDDTLTPFYWKDIYET